MPVAAALLLTLAMATVPVSAPDSARCAGLVAPVDGPVVAEFAPVGSYGGHWGIDYGVAEGTPVVAAAAGIVTFAGSVAGMLAVTVDHGGGLKTSYSYLSEVGVVAGSRVSTRSRLGNSGIHHGVAALHFSTRLDRAYQDPRPWLRCLGSPSGALRLSSAYPFGRATWHPRWDVRSPSFRTPLYGRGCLLAAGARRCLFSACRRPLAENRHVG